VTRSVVVTPVPSALEPCWPSSGVKVAGDLPWLPPTGTQARSPHRPRSLARSRPRRRPPWEPTRPHPTSRPGAAHRRDPRRDIDENRVVPVPDPPSPEDVADQSRALSHRHVRCHLPLSHTPTRAPRHEREEKRTEPLTQGTYTTESTVQDGGE
jgi:hypothetical protein